MSRFDGHGPSAREQAILDRYEACRDIATVADELGLTRRYCEQVVRELFAPKLDNWQSSARMGSELLYRAIRRHHPERCGVAA